MRKIYQLKLAVAALFLFAGAALLVTNNFTNRTVHAFSAGPPAGYTRAPGEEPDACRECHLPQDAGAGNIRINVPPTYAPGQTYQISVVHTNADQTRKRWGFQLTALDDINVKAGTLSTSGDGLTQVLNNQGPFPSRQYIEHTSLGNFDNQTGGATWTFNWTAPAEDVGPVTFYAAGNHANGNGNSDGDEIYFTFATSAPAAADGDFSINVAPATQTILPGASGAYTVTVTPSNNFTGTVNLSLAGLPAGVNASFNPASVQITDATARSSTLNVTADASAPLGNFTLTVTGASGNLQHTATAVLVTGPSMIDAGLGVRKLLGGFNQPIGLAVIGANDFFVLEKATGKVIRQRLGTAGSGTVLDLAVNSASERGLLGIALHPQFPSNPRVYLYWTESSTGADTTNTDEVPLVGNRVDSFLWDGATLTFERNLIKLRALQQDAGQPSRGNHNGGIIRFGPDGKLYIVIGDNGRRGLLQNLPFGPSVNVDGPTVADDQFGGPEPDNAHLTGVVLRLNDDGTTPPDNPFFNAATNLTGEAAGNVKKVFAYGIRNSFGMAFDPASGQLWTQENGDDSFDEINRVVPAFDGGWIQTMGPSSRVAEYKAIELSRSGGLQQNRWTPDRIADFPSDARARLFRLPGAIYTEPEFSWKYAVAPSSLGFIRGRALGAQNEGALVIGASRTTLAGGYLFRFNFSSERRKFLFAEPRLGDLVADNADKFDLTESESLLFGRDFGITTDIQTAPGGNLYVVSLSDGVVYEIFARPSTLQFDAAASRWSEGKLSADITVTRGGDTSGAVAVNYRTLDDPAAVPCDPSARKPDGAPYPQGTAYARCDYATVTGTLSFAPGETSRTFNVPLVDDAHDEADETFRVELFAPAGATLGAPSVHTLTIADNDAADAPNPILDSTNHFFFVRQQYLDFLSREPEPAGLEAWLNVLSRCSDVNQNPNCDRVAVSSSFFRSPEFQLKGYYVYRFYKVSLGRLPRYDEIILDMASVTAATAPEVYVRRDDFARDWLARPDFKTLYPDTLTPAEYVDKLLLTAQMTLEGFNTRDTLVADLETGRKTRAEVLRILVEHVTNDPSDFNAAFVAMQYFGYLRRDPEPDGYRNWLDYLNTHPGDYRTMVRGFLYSTEYLLRFGKV